MAKMVPLIPFPRGTVLLPGVVYRLSVPATRPDIPALVAAVCHEMAAGPDGGGGGAVPVVCVPHRSPLIGPDGQLLIQDGSETPTAVLEEQPPPAAVVDKAEFFGYGTAARIVAFGGGAAGELSVVVEGTGRVKMGKVSEETPYFKGQVEFVTEEIPLQDTQLRDLFTLLKARSVELIAAHVSSLISNPPYASSHPLHVANVRRIGLIVRGAQLKDSGSLADLMTSVISSTYEEKLQVLATLDVKTRVVKVIELLERQVDELKTLLKAAALAALQARMVEGWSSRGRRPRRRPAPLPPADGSHNNPFLPPAGPSSSSGPHSSWDDNGAAEPNELEELQTRLEAAQLPPDAVKMAARELRRLQKMAPANQEYQVVRNWLETLSEIPWSAVTHDRLDQTTLASARRQLDDDHYGLEPVKKRLIEYLAVLRLKQSVNDDVDAQIGQLERQIAAASTSGGDGSEPAADRSSSSSPEQGPAAATTTTTTTETTTAATTAVNDSSRSRSSIQQVLESLRARRISADGSPPIMLLVGPPGVGKTSLAKSVAAALGRKFHRICLGGIRDEAEIRGHRRTYVAAMPGILVQALRKVAVANPVILLDEIDKLSGSSHHGDPSAAMLEVLDPEQNRGFTDHYVGTPVDLSRVLFIATANDPDAISAPLLDRMETIAIPGYTTLEKRHIALRHLVPRQVAAHGLGPGQIQFDTAVVSVIIESYTREAGVRGLEREVAAMCRAKAVELAEARDAGRPETYRSQLTVEDVGRILGDARFEDEILDAAAEGGGATAGGRSSGISSRPGVVTGLVAYSRGGTGSILFIEIADMPGDGKVQLTGQLGSVLQESVSVALSWVKAHAFDIGLTQDPTVNIMQDRSIHVHCPAGAVPKDGPSSGIAQAIALISLFAAKPVPPTMAMTGEISLRGRITAVGGIKEKMIGALRAGVKTVLLPAQNRNDVRDLPQEVKDGIEIYPVSHIWEAIRLVWPDWRQDTSPHQSYSGIESQL